MANPTRVSATWDVHIAIFGIAGGSSPEGCPRRPSVVWATAANLRDRASLEAPGETST